MRSKPYAKNLRKTLKYKLLLDFLHGFSSHISTTRRVFQKIAQKAFFEVPANMERKDYYYEQRKSKYEH